MLLLVLILVVIAFGLLVVALLTGSVLWAWVSVGVSVVAAIVLLVDWLQRRSAVKAGAAPTAAEPVSRPLPMVDLDPATEVLPIVPTSAGRSGPGPDGPTVERSERVPDAQQTVAMPVVQPSGSSARPSSAEATITSSGGVSSPSVTKGGADRSASPAAGDHGDEVTRTMSGPPSAAADATVSVPREPRAESAAAKPSLTKDEPGTSQKPAGAAGSPAQLAASEEGRPVEDDRAADAAPAEAGPTPPAQGSAAEQTVVTALPAVTPRAPGADAGPTGSSNTVPAVAPEAPAAAGPPGNSSAVPAGAPASRAAAGPTGGVEETVKVQAQPPKKAEAPPVVGGSTAEPAPGDRSGATEASPVPSDPPAQAEPAQAVAAEDPSPPAREEKMDLFAPAVPATPPAPEPPPASSGDAPEEPHDPAAAETVRDLEDEVVVVDEQPRYHVGSCRSLAAVAVIPLPVREAVELGFTPCGWCTPDRTLTARHRTAAR